MIDPHPHETTGPASAGPRCCWARYCSRKSRLKASASGAAFLFVIPAKAGSALLWRS
ncbi:hypothetical protein [Lysobacter gummosus]|uniref:hypothetical protein n=1 Tax=Lysobacter gummosus TaxID=262324 RepID=UPI003633E5D1